jgi:hypothetical protein
MDALWHISGDQPSPAIQRRVNARGICRGRSCGSTARPSGQSFSRARSVGPQTQGAGPTSEIKWTNSKQPLFKKTKPKQTESYNPLSRA